MEGEEDIEVKIIEEEGSEKEVDDEEGKIDEYHEILGQVTFSDNIKNIVLGGYRHCVWVARWYE